MSFCSRSYLPLSVYLGGLNPPNFAHKTAKILNQILKPSGGVDMTLNENTTVNKILEFGCSERKCDYEHTFCVFLEAKKLAWLTIFDELNHFRGQVSVIRSKMIGKKKI